ncbi:cob(I)yrinic acid a,c-diamide adenosyltransferase [Carboxydothermus ferrireducens]|uniref:Cob(I)alamin adenosyltransferase n=1 Tax=Carboxydothermus ferrireducens DSM 11255 TaxID=1119529 RepID=A0ABX2R8Z1_9THEO|nr:cob(I)yrinic acid a,c-diamide adenosyltransferase [Carboxydothermus ferrireducens]NYE57646.1 cob(I)alamin adenosyltransferase [Carboxydothermus ferrireducens DSM 11255]
MGKEKGLVLVFTGNGKGKTTSALGMALRAWGQGMRILVLQFIKGGWKYGELKAAEALGERFVMRQMGEGFLSEEKFDEHRRAAQEALEEAKKEILSGNWDMIILDEIIYSVGYGLVDEEQVLDLIKIKPEKLHLVLTGRNASERIIEAADLVSEIREIKHPYQKGIPAQKGIEF